MVDLVSFPSSVTRDSLLESAARAAVCAAVTAVFEDGAEMELAKVVEALGVLTGTRVEPRHLLSWELARASAALDAALDGYGVGERPLEDDAVQVWVCSAADSMVAHLELLLEGRDAGAFMNAAFCAIDETFGEHDDPPVWRPALRDAFCDPENITDASLLLGNDQHALREMMLCVEWAREGSFDVILTALEAAGPDMTVEVLGPYLMAWYAVPALVDVVVESAVAAAGDEDPAAVCAVAFGFYDETLAELEDPDR